MPHCWTCNSATETLAHECSACKTLDEVKHLRSEVTSGSESLQDSLHEVARVQQLGFDRMASSLSDGFAEVSEELAMISSTLHWGFEEIVWRLGNQTEVLKSIDHTLKTPSETKANEFRLMADELRNRGAIEDALEFYERAIDSNRLDYRIYIGLAHVLILLDRFEEARTHLEKSLVHAPQDPAGIPLILLDGGALRLRGAKPESYALAREIYGEVLFGDPGGIKKALSKGGIEAENHDYWLFGLGMSAREDFLLRERGYEIDRYKSQSLNYRSYSLRLLAHIASCKENYAEALDSLQEAVRLSPDYADAIYDYAQCHARLGNVEEARNHLMRSVQKKPVLGDFAKYDAGFETVRDDVLQVETDLRSTLQQVREEVRGHVLERKEQVEASAKATFPEVAGAIQRAKEASEVARVGFDSSLGEDLQGLESKLTSKFGAIENLLESSEKDLTQNQQVPEGLFKLVKAEHEATLAEAIVISDLLDLKRRAEKREEEYRENRASKVRAAWGRVPGALIGLPLGLTIMGAISGCVLGLAAGDANAGSSGGALLGLLGGLGYGAHVISKELS